MKVVFVSEIGHGFNYVHLCSPNFQLSIRPFQLMHSAERSELAPKGRCDFHMTPSSLALIHTSMYSLALSLTHSDHR